MSGGMKARALKTGNSNSANAVSQAEALVRSNLGMIRDAPTRYKFDARGSFGLPVWRARAPITRSDVQDRYMANLSRVLNFIPGRKGVNSLRTELALLFAHVGFESVTFEKSDAADETGLVFCIMGSALMLFLPEEEDVSLMAHALKQEMHRVAAEEEKFFADAPVPEHQVCQSRDFGTWIGDNILTFCFLAAFCQQGYVEVWGGSKGFFAYQAYEDGTVVDSFFGHSVVNTNSYGGYAVTSYSWPMNTCFQHLAKVFYHDATTTLRSIATDVAKERSRYLFEINDSNYRPGTAMLKLWPAENEPIVSKHLFAVYLEDTKRARTTTHAMYLQVTLENPDS
jgi:hypothetical protein